MDPTSKLTVMLEARLSDLCHLISQWSRNTTQCYAPTDDLSCWPEATSPRLLHVHNELRRSPQPSRTVAYLSVPSRDTPSAVNFHVFIISIYFIEWHSETFIDFNLTSAFTHCSMCVLSYVIIYLPAYLLTYLATVHRRVTASVQYPIWGERVGIIL